MKRRVTENLLKRLSKLIGIVALIFTANSVSAEAEALDDRVTNVRNGLKALQERDNVADDSEFQKIGQLLPSQWNNWPNWGNWGNWPNWGNWNDWNNWANWNDFWNY